MDGDFCCFINFHFAWLQMNQENEQKNGKKNKRKRKKGVNLFWVLKTRTNPNRIGSKHLELLTSKLSIYVTGGHRWYLSSSKELVKNRKSYHDTWLFSPILPLIVARAFNLRARNNFLMFSKCTLRIHLFHEKLHEKKKSSRKMAFFLWWYVTKNVFRSLVLIWNMILISWLILGQKEIRIFEYFFIMFYFLFFYFFLLPRQVSSSSEPCRDLVRLQLALLQARVGEAWAHWLGWAYGRSLAVTKARRLVEGGKGKKKNIIWYILYYIIFKNSRGAIPDSDFPTSLENSLT